MHSRKKKKGSFLGSSQCFETPQVCLA